MYYYIIFDRVRLDVEVNDSEPINRVDREGRSIHYKTEYSVFDKDNWVAKWNEEILEENTVKLVRSINDRNKQ